MPIVEQIILFTTLEESVTFRSLTGVGHVATSISTVEPMFTREVWGGDVSHGNWYLGKVELVSDKRYLAFSVYFVINFLIPMIFSRVIKLAVSSDHNTDSKEFIVFCSIKPNSNSMQFIQ